MIDNLFVPMQPEDRQSFKDALQRGSQIYAANGTVTSLEMDALKVPDNDDKHQSNIDNLTMSRRRSSRLTNESQWRVKAKGNEIERQTKEGSKRQEQTCKSLQAISAQSQERETLKIKSSNSSCRI